MSKITPIHKKGDKTNISNYRPISNLCSMSKVFEKLIMQRIHEIEDLNITSAPIKSSNKQEEKRKKKRCASRSGW